MRYDGIIFNDYEMDNILNGRKNKDIAKKSLILYFFTIENLDGLLDKIYLPESIFMDELFFESIRSFFGNIGLSITPKFINNGILHYSCNPLRDIEEMVSKYKIKNIHYPVEFGKRLIQKSPKFDEYVINSQYNWTNIVLLYEWCNKNEIELIVEINLSFFENSSEDYYIHMRQILWEGIDIFRKYNIKFNKISLIIPVFYPKLKGLRNSDIIDPYNVAHTTLRCITECLTKEKMRIILKTCNEFSLLGYMRYINYFKGHNRENTINSSLSSYCLKDYIEKWDFKEKNLKDAQKEFLRTLSST